MSKNKITNQELSNISGGSKKLTATALAVVSMLQPLTSISATKINNANTIVSKSSNSKTYINWLKEHKVPVTIASVFTGATISVGLCLATYLINYLKNNEKLIYTKLSKLNVNDKKFNKKFNDLIDKQIICNEKIKNELENILISKNISDDVRGYTGSQLSTYLKIDFNAELAQLKEKIDKCTNRERTISDFKSTILAIRLLTFESSKLTENLKKQQERFLKSENTSELMSYTNTLINDSSAVKLLVGVDISKDNSNIENSSEINSKNISENKQENVESKRTQVNINQSQTNDQTEQVQPSAVKPIQRDLTQTPVISIAKPRTIESEEIRQEKIAENTDSSKVIIKSDSNAENMLTYYNENTDKKILKILSILNANDPKTVNKLIEAKNDYLQNINAYILNKTTNSDGQIINVNNGIKILNDIILNLENPNFDKSFKSVSDAILYANYFVLISHIITTDNNKLPEELKVIKQNILMYDNVSDILKQFKNKNINTIAEIKKLEFKNEEAILDKTTSEILNDKTTTAVVATQKMSKALSNTQPENMEINNISLKENVNKTDKEFKLSVGNLNIHKISISFEIKSANEYIKFANSCIDNVDRYMQKANNCLTKHRNIKMIKSNIASATTDINNANSNIAFADRAINNIKKMYVSKETIDNNADLEKVEKRLKEAKKRFEEFKEKLDKLKQSLEK